MRSEDEITLIGAAVVAERLWLAAYSPQNLSRGPVVQEEKLENRSGGPLSEAWLSPSPSQSLPSEEHPIWQVGCGRVHLYIFFISTRMVILGYIFELKERFTPYVKIGKLTCGGS